jgi:peptidoglycan/xylan/chitin deacetylase (PgdA/CDA1 family)
VRRAVVLLSVLALLFMAWGAWSVSDARGFQLFGHIVDRVETASPVVALTFDDGPTAAGADSILAILQRRGVRATFFFTGAEMQENPALAPRFVRAGHELGNHSWSHRRMLLRPPSFIRSEIERTDSLIRAAGHRGAIHFRPPYGKKLVGLPWYLARTGRTTIMWDVEPDSYPEVAASAERIVAHVSERARPGSIILLHVMYASRRESLGAVEGVIEELQARGLRFVTVSELLRAQ